MQQVGTVDFLGETSQQHEAPKRQFDALQEIAILLTQNSHWQARADDMDKRFASEQQNGSIKGHKRAQVSDNSLP